MIQQTITVKENEAVTAPPRFGGERNGDGLAQLVETLAAAVASAVPVIRKLEQEAERHRQYQQSSVQNLEASAAAMQQRLETIAGRLPALEQNLEATLREVARLANSVTQLAGCYDLLAQNSEQLRTLVQNAARKSEQLADDFIERQVADAHFKELARLYFALSRLSNNGALDVKLEVQALAGDIWRNLETAGLRLINPKRGEGFDPRKHHPEKIVPADNQELEGKIAHTFYPGLSRPHRVVQPARVAVFKVS